MADSLLEQYARNQFGCYWLLHLHLRQGTLTRPELRLRYERVLPEDDERIGNVLAMTEAVLRAGVSQYLAQPWPLRCVADLPAEYFVSDTFADAMLQMIHGAIASKAPVCRWLIRTFHQRLAEMLPAAMARVAASRADEVGSYPPSSVPARPSGSDAVHSTAPPFRTSASSNTPDRNTVRPRSAESSAVSRPLGTSAARPASRASGQADQFDGRDELMRYLSVMRLNPSGPSPTGGDELTRISDCLLEQSARNEFGCFWLLNIQLRQGIVTREELRYRYERVLLNNEDQLGVIMAAPAAAQQQQQAAPPEADNGHINNVLAMTAAVVRAGVPQYLAHAWSIRYVAELPDAFMRDARLVDGLLQAVYAGMSVIQPMGRDAVRALQQRIEEELQQAKVDMPALAANIASGAWSFRVATGSTEREKAAEDDCIAPES